MTSKKQSRNLANYACDITGNSPGKLNLKEQPVSYHPGAKQPWPCHHCEEILPTNKMFTEHYKWKHNIREFLYFCKCGYSSITVRSTGAHMKYCDGSTPKEHLKEYRCDLWKFSSDTKNGLMVHRSTSHKDVYNEELKEKEKGYRWTNQEYQYLAKLVRRLVKEKVGQINMRARKKLGRTKEAIQKVRQRTEYRRIERMIIEQEGREEELSNNKVIKEPTTEPLVTGTCCNTPNRLEQQRAPSRAAMAYFNIPQEPTTPYTPRNVIKRKLPAVPPTPVEVDDFILKLMLSQRDISIVGTPNVTRKLPQTPQNSSQNKILQVGVSQEFGNKTRFSLAGVHQLNTTRVSQVGVS